MIGIECYNENILGWYAPNSVFRRFLIDAKYNLLKFFILPTPPVILLISDHDAYDEF